MNETLVCVPFSSSKIIAQIEKENKIISGSWQIKVTERGVFDFPKDLLKKLNWAIDDELEWIDQYNGTFTLTKINKKTND
tara:strand:- start:37 stop:276 length:240 start_codon:yes stop_codon:yes gene_type:complete